MVRQAPYFKRIKKKLFLKKEKVILGSSSRPEAPRVTRVKQGIKTFCF